MSRRQSVLRQPFREEGATLVETAITLVVLFMFLIGIMEFGRFMYVYHFTSEVAREATRYAMVRGSTWGTTACSGTQTMACNATAANVTTYVQSLTPPAITSSSWTTSTSCQQLATNNPVVATCWPGTNANGNQCYNSNGNNSPGCQVEVVVSMPFKFYLPFLPKTSYTVQSTSWMVISQ